MHAISGIACTRASRCVAVPFPTPFELRHAYCTQYRGSGRRYAMAWRCRRRWMLRRTLAGRLRRSWLTRGSGAMTCRCGRMPGCELRPSGCG
eukprot:284604-Chlamydomonas_euryale.AAC.2